MKYATEREMAKSNAQIQRAYRVRARMQGDGQRRIDTWLPTATFLELERISKHYRVSKRDVLIRLLAQEDQRLLEGMDDTEFEEYMRPTD